MSKKQIIIVGLGRFGTSVTLSLAKQGHDILAIDILEENLKHISNKVTQCLNVDIKNPDIIEGLNLSNFDAAIIAIGEDLAASVLATMVMKNAKIPIIIAKAKDEIHGTILNELGATKIIYPERDTGVRVANNLFQANILDFFQLSEEFSITEIKAPKCFINKTIDEIGVRHTYKVNIIAIKNNNKINADIQRDTTIYENDSLFIVGATKAINKFKNLK